ncbi:HpcH/HpaI aldolase family protein [Pseudooceanicola aestuarii]|uniref:HpcH/HpaI aldolase family protein n=1 Tax=Pseudooceanicola aestuarii TaxID=2697319 RepID=UPI0013D8A0BF|nr:aldolase/citrate lyase family protein [Pseudooceanicola aestuarii]
MTSLKERLATGTRQIGVFLKTPAPHLVELSAAAGCDFVAPDMEHAPLDLSHVDAMVGFAGRSGIPVLPRVPGKDPALIGRLLDLGAQGILVPHVSTADQAQALVAATRFDGGRGFSPSPRAGDYGAMGAARYKARQADHVLTALQIEDRAGLDNADAIAAVPGVDALFVGPADLSLSLGVGLPSEALDHAIARILAAGQTAGRACGIFVADGAAAARRLEQGFAWAIVGSDQSLLTAALRRERTAARPDVT